MMKYLPDSAPAPVVILLVVLASVLVGMIFSLLLGVAAIHFNADQTLVGTALNLLGPAAAVVIVRASTWQKTQTTFLPQLPTRWLRKRS